MAEYRVPFPISFLIQEQRHIHEHTKLYTTRTANKYLRLCDLGGVHDKERVLYLTAKSTRWFINEVLFAVTGDRVVLAVLDS